MVEPIIKTENLRVIYNQGKSNEVRSLENANLEIYPEEYIIIYGPSGCGKSTLLYSIAGLQMPTYGEVTIEGKKLSRMKKRDKVELHQTGIGMVFQAFYLVPSLSVLGNVCLPKTFMGADKKEREKGGMNLLSRFSIAEQSKKFPSELSGGQKQRVAIARTLVNNPRIILADEPVGNLDSESAENVLNIFKELNNVDKKTIVMVTHNSDHLHFADRIIHMKDGKIIREEINREKRPKRAVKSSEDSKLGDVPNELKILMRTFKNLTPEQIGILLIPFKAKQLLHHVLSELTEEQMKMAEGFLKDLLFHNITVDSLQERLDLDFEKGGAEWNKQRSRSFSQRIGSILGEVESISNDQDFAHVSLAEYLTDLFNIRIEDRLKLRFQSFLKMRIENRIDSFGLKQRLDTSIDLGGVGFYKNTADEITGEVEILMLLKYSV